jgi:cytochrome c oxidase subunit 2
MIQFLITAEDVIHSWNVPAFGIKVDAIPGRLNVVDTMLVKEGCFMVNVLKYADHTIKQCL